MKNLSIKRMIAILLTGAMTAGVLAGCAGDNGTESVDAPSESKVTESSIASSSSTEAEVEEEFSYPMKDKKLTHYASMTGQMSGAGYENYADTEYAKAVMEATGVEVEYVTTSGEIGVFLAEGDYPDIFEGWMEVWYTGGLEGLAEDGVIIELTDVIDQYMPNLKAWMEKNPSAAECFYTADGKIYRIPFVYENEDMLATTGLMIRQDWLEELGLDIPETIDDWHEVLTAFKEEKDVIPYSIQGSYFIEGCGLGFAYCPGGNYVLDTETGKVEFKMTSDEYREYLTVMNEWYDEGLIDPDIATVNVETQRAKFNAGETGAKWDWTATLESVPDMDVVAVANPVKEEGAIVHRSPAGQVSTYCAAISTQCEDIETAARYMDWFFSPEGVLVTNFGVEGVSYTMEENGPVFTDEILNNPDGLTMDAAKGKYIRSYSGFLGMRAYDYEMQSYVLPRSVDSYAIWGSVGTTDYRMPAAVKLSSEDAVAAADIEADALTYARETAMKFLIGTEDIESGWDEYVKTLEQFGMDEVVAMWQSAYDAYLAR